jgi:hypothetical protein
MIERLNHAERLDFLALRLVCNGAEGFALDNPCSDLHGGFGLMLHAHFPDIYQALYGAQADSGSVRPYVLKPGRALFQSTVAADVFSIELILYGQATCHAPRCVEALRRLGENGITHARHRFSVQRVDRLGPSGPSEAGLVAAGGGLPALIPTTARSVLTAAPAAAAWRIHLETPLAIKHGNALLKMGLNARIFFERLIGRAQLLATQQGGAPLLDAETKRGLLDQASRIQLAADATQWVAASRYSVRQRQYTEFGGLMGDFELHDVTPHLAAWLAMAPWLHVGSKTSFGLGACQLTPLAAGA